MKLDRFNTENSDILTKAIFEGVSNAGLRILVLLLARKGKHLFSQRNIAQMAGISKSAANRAVIELKECGYLVERVNNYYINIVWTVPDLGQGVPEVGQGVVPDLGQQYNTKDTITHTHTIGNKTKYFGIKWAESEAVMGLVNISGTELNMSIAELVAFDKRCKGLNLTQSNIEEIIGSAQSEYFAQREQNNRGAISRGGKYLNIALEAFLRLREQARKVQIVDGKRKYYGDKDKAQSPPVRGAEVYRGPTPKLEKEAS